MTDFHKRMGPSFCDRPAEGRCHLEFSDSKDGAIFQIPISDKGLWNLLHRVVDEMRAREIGSEPRALTVFRHE